jgi:hypothetical protein
MGFHDGRTRARIAHIRSTLILKSTCTKYLQMTFVTPRFLEFARSTNSSGPLEGKTRNQ